MVYVRNETEDGTTGFTDRGVECLEELLLISEHGTEESDSSWSMNNATPKGSSA